ncbi:dd-gdca protein [Anaeramoeba flamelloides]|uniref:Dd-gdca protein n=1 Tax=Anaeramoeba flamelloides TaxID=1746091 RepID=A0AAV7YD58_9EUKA|nr:dd-gdca protein [Anaeramoeba flamelloides]
MFLLSITVILGATGCSSTTKYVGVGGHCKIEKGLLCEENCFCNTTSQCQRDNTGHPCTSGSECFGSLCVEGKCSYHKSINDPCSMNSDCLSGMCKNGRCVGKEKGAHCDPSLTQANQCGLGLTCDSLTKSCIDHILPGEDCISHLSPYFLDWASVCGSGYFCDMNLEYTKGVCKRILSVPEGGECGTAIVCQLGLGCRNGVCKKTSPGDVCNGLVGVSLQCPWFSRCECQEGEMGKCLDLANYEGCQPYADKFISCEYEKKCPAQDYPVSGTCLGDECDLSYQCCLRRNHEKTFQTTNNVSC